MMTSNHYKAKERILALWLALALTFAMMPVPPGDAWAAGAVPDGTTATIAQIFPDPVLANWVVNNLPSAADSSYTPTVLELAGITNVVLYLSETALADWTGLEYLTNLTDLSLSGTNISGDIGNFPASLTNLTYLSLFNTGIRGDIGNFPTSLTNLTVLSLHWTNISGDIKDLPASLTNLQQLDLSRTNVSGDIKDLPASLTNLQRLDLSQTNISGDIKDLPAFLTKLTSLFLHLTNISGDLKDLPAFLTNLTNLFLSGTNISGDIGNFPASLTKLTSLGLSEISITLPAITFTDAPIAVDVPVKDMNHTPIAPTNLSLSGSYADGKVTWQIPAGTSGRFSYDFNTTGTITSLNFVYSGTVYQPFTVTQAPTTEPPTTEPPVTEEPTTEESLEKFVMGEDNYNFKNSSKSFGYPEKYYYYIPLARFQAVLSNVEAQYYYGLDNPWGGSCYGFSSSSLRFNAGSIPHETYQSGTNKTYDFTIPSNPRNPELIELMEIYQVSQRIRNLQNHTYSINRNNYTGLINAANNANKTGLLVMVFGMYEGRMSGHAVVAYDITNKGGGVYELSIYDNNYPDDLNRRMLVDTMANTWSYKILQDGTTFGTNNSSEDYFSFHTLSLIEYEISAALNHYNTESEYGNMNIIVPSQASEITLGNVPIENVPGAYEAIPMGIMEGEGSPVREQSIWNVPEGVYTVKPGEGGDNPVIFFDSNTSFEIQTDDAEAVIVATVGEAGYARIVSETAHDFTITYMTNQIADTPLTISGRAEGAFTVLTDTSAPSDADAIILSGEAEVTVSRGSESKILHVTADNSLAVNSDLDTDDDPRIPLPEKVQVNQTPQGAMQFDYYTVLPGAANRQTFVDAILDMTAPEELLLLGGGRWYDVNGITLAQAVKQSKVGVPSANYEAILEDGLITTPDAAALIDQINRAYPLSPEKAQPIYAAYQRLSDQERAAIANNEAVRDMLALME
jgi:hypothetical protein